MLNFQMVRQVTVWRGRSIR